MNVDPSLSLKVKKVSKLKKIQVHVWNNRKVFVLEFRWCLNNSLLFISILINSVHQPSSWLWENFVYTSQDGMPEEAKATAEKKRKCSDRYCINCIRVVLISLHFINLIKIFGRSLHAKWVSFCYSRVHDVNYYFNNNGGAVWSKNSIKNANCAVNRFMFIFNRSVSRFKMLS